jgi:ABC-2 type transport system permease protein
MSRPGSIPWLAGHELRLAWRDWLSMVTAGNRRRLSTAVAVLVFIGIVLHLPAWAIVARFAEDGVVPDKASLVSVSLIVVLYVSLLLSQAMETVTRTLYARGDLDLVLSSPVSPRRLFAVRIGVNAALIATVALVISAPFVDVLTLAGGARWLAGFGLAIGLGAAAAAIAVAITIGLFRVLGARRTRLVAQVLAAMIGAGFAIGIQAFAIIYYGTMVRPAMDIAHGFIAIAPGVDSPLWWPARAILGDWAALAGVLLVCFAILAAVIAVFAPRLGEHSLAATDLAAPSGRHRRRGRRFALRTPASALRRKEWLLLRRDPWLASQTLTQLFYLVPPALLLVRNFGDATGVAVVVVMVLVTVGGQLGGALAWLAISGEDAPDLVMTAPVRSLAVTRAKVEAVMGAVAMVLAPFLLVLASLSPLHAAAAILGIAVAAASTIRIQLWFRAQARRSNFRRRHTSSRIATLAEALTSFSWAAATGLAAAGTFSLAAISAAIALLVLVGARSVSPRKAFA